MGQKNFPLAEQLHSQFVDQWAKKMVQVVQENPVEMIFAIQSAMDEARESKEIKPLHVLKWLGDIFTSQLRDAAFRAVEMGELMSYLDKLEHYAKDGEEWHNDDPEPTPLVEESPEDEWGRMSALRDEYDGEEQIPF